MVPDGGSFSTTDTSLVISENSQYLPLFVSATLKHNDISANAEERAQNYLERAAAKEYSSLLNNHIAFYQQYFNRVSIDLGTTDSIKNNTGKRMSNLARREQPALVASISIWTLFADLFLTAGRATSQSPGYLGQTASFGVGQQIYGQYQYRNELLAFGSNQSKRNKWTTGQNG